MPQRKIVENFLSLLSGEAVSKLLGFATTVYLARTLGAETFGELGFAFAVFAFFLHLAQQGFDLVGIREAACSTSQPSDLLSSLFSLKWVFSSCALFLLVLFCWITPLSVSSRIVLLFMGFNLLLLPFQLQFYFQGRQEMKIVAAGRIVLSGTYLALCLAFVQGTSHLFRVPLLLFSSASLASLVQYGYFTRRSAVNPFRFGWIGTPQLLQSSFTMGIASGLILIYVYLDTVILGLFRSVQEVGLYTAAYRIVFFLSVIPNLIFSSYLPQLSDENSNPSLRTVLKEYCGVMAGIGVPVGFAGIFLAGWILRTLYGAAYDDAAFAFQILLFNVTGVFFSMALANPLIAWRKDREYLRVVATGAATNILLSFILIPPYGIIGAAVATLLSEVAVSIAAYARLRGLNVASVHSFVLKPLALATLSFIPAWGLHHLLEPHPLVSASLFLLLYASAARLQSVRESAVSFNAMRAEGEAS